MRERKLSHFGGVFVACPELLWTSFSASMLINTSTEQVTKTQPKQDNFSPSHFPSFLTIYLLNVICGLTKGISLKMCILCVHVKISMHLFEPFCVWISDWDKSIPLLPNSDSIKYTLNHYAFIFWPMSMQITTTVSGLQFALIISLGLRTRNFNFFFNTQRWKKLFF